MYEALAELARLALTPLAVDEVLERGFDIFQRTFGAVAVALSPGPATQAPETVDFSFPLGPDEAELVLTLPARLAQSADRRLLQVAALQFGAAIRSARLTSAHLQLRGEAETDALTGIANRRTFEATLREEWQRALRRNEPIALAIVDVDYFKDYNDRYGHAAGDRCLHAVAQAIASAARRAGELCARYGGEEFAVVLPGLTLRESVETGEAIRAAVGEAQLEHERSQLRRVTVSIGLASMVPSQANDSSELVAIADAALYDAKKRGRNRTVAEGYESQAPPALRRFDSRHNMPNYSTGFLGRERELEQLASLLQTHRMVSVVGPGGVGKTRIAVAAGGEFASYVKDGACFVDLSGLFDRDRIFDRVASAIGVREDPLVPIEQTLIERFRDVETLLVLDNCEHLIEGVVEAVAAIMRGTAGVRILATSRIPLDVPGEAGLRVAPLPAPQAIELFRDRGAAALESDASDEAIGALCEQLDGIPMAIELAAARLSTLSLDEVVSGLADRFSVLVSRAGAKPDRQQTLASLFAWSCDLLEEREREALAQLTVFAGTFAQSAGACVVMTDFPHGTIDALVRKSLLLREESGRLRLPNSLIEFAKRELDDERRRVVEYRHAKYYVDFVARANQEYTKVPARDWLASLQLEENNVLAALGRMELGSHDAIAIGAKLAGESRRYYELSGRLREGLDWLERFIAALPAQASAEIRALLHVERARLLQLRSETVESLASSREAVKLYRQTGNADGLAYALEQYGHAEMFAGNTDRAERVFEEVLAMYDTTLDNPNARAVMLCNLGNIAMYFRFDLERAERFFNEALTVFHELKHEANEAWAFGTLAEIRYRRDRHESALDFAELAVAQYRAIGEHPNLPAELERYARILLALGRTDEAAAPLAEALERFVRNEHAPGIIETVVDFANLAARRGRWEAAAALLGYARSRPREVKQTSFDDESSIAEPIEAALGKVRFDEALRYGAGADLAGLIAAASVAPA